MHINLTVNAEALALDVQENETLLAVLRRSGYFGVKHGCEDGTCGACLVLVDGTPANACVTLAAQVAGRHITTIEGIGGEQRRGWKGSEPLHPLQQAFVETGAIQCGYCTPGLILAAKALLDKNPSPSEDEVRDALSGVLCRCTGYKKPVQAIMQVAGGKEGGAGHSSEGIPFEAVFGTPPVPAPDLLPGAKPRGPSTATSVVMPTLVIAPTVPNTKVVGKPEIKVDALKIVQGKPAFTDDIEMRGLLHAKVLWSPVAHARLKRIDASRARALPGVAAVLTYQDIPRVVYSTAGQSDPIPGPLDMFSLDYKVRYAGDRVAFVAAETPEIAERALALIDVEYQELPAIFDPREAMQADAVRIHDEPEYVPFDHCDPQKNLAASIRIDIGNVEEGFQQADRIFEYEYRVPKVQQVSIEPHVVVTWWDEDDRLVIRTSTQVPFHVRRILSPVLGLSAKRIRVVKPRIGGGFGGKQEVMIEDVAAHLTIATGRPVRFEYTRAEEFFTARSRHPMRIRMKTGVSNDGRIIANEMVALSDTGAYGCHALTVTGNTGHKSMALYNAPHIRFYADIVYTNTPPAGAFRGYGVPQGAFAVDAHIERIAREMGFDPIEFRLKNAVKPGDEHPFSRVWSEGREPVPEIIKTCGLEECVRQGAEAIGWYEQRAAPYHVVAGKPHLRRGLGMATVMQGTAIPYLDMGAASIKINDDGSFNLLVGATDLGTGSDTVLAQMAAEVLGVPLDDIIMYSSDTDFTPFDKGAYASSTTYISGAAVVKAAEQVAAQIREVAFRMLAPNSSAEPPFHPNEIALRDRRAFAPDGRAVSLADVALESLHRSQQKQIMAVASYVSPESPPPFAAQFAQVLVDTQTGEVRVEKLVMAVDSGVIVNPLTASGQIEGGMTQALGYAVCEEMTYDERGQALQRNLNDYKVFAANEMPQLETIFVETYEPSHPFGVKAVAEIPMDGVAPAVANAVYDAADVWIQEIPMTPERVWRALAGK